MTKRDFIQKAFISAIQGKGPKFDADDLTDLYDQLGDVADIIEDANKTLSHRSTFDDNQYEGLSEEMYLALNNCQDHGGFCIQFNQEYPLNVKTQECQQDHS